MAVELWLGQDFDTSHERQALDRFLADMKASFGQSDKPCLILANYYIEGRQVDLTVLKHDAVIVIELKECADPFLATENGKWLTIPDGRVVGTGEQNPFEQAKDYRFRWIDLLTNKKDEFLSPTKAQGMRFDHVSAFVVMSPSIHLTSQNQISPVPWFRLVGLDELTQAVGQQTSRRLNFSEQELRTLVADVLHLRPSDSVIIQGVEKKPSAISRDVAIEIINALKDGTTPLGTAHYLDVGRERWYKGMQFFFDIAEHGGSKVRFIRGRYGDGKTHLMDMAQHFALERGFVVSYASAEDTQLNKLDEVYRRIVKNLRTADTKGGIEFLLRKWQARVGQETEREIEQLRSADALDIDFRTVVQSYLPEHDPQRQDRIVQWLLGKQIKLPELNVKRYLRIEDSRDMMRSLSVFLRLIGYRGLLILLDELDTIQYQSERIRNNCYQVLRELMDNADGHGGMQGTLFYWAAPSEMFTSDRGFSEYPALKSRLEPAMRIVENGAQPRHVDYRAAIINLEDTPLQVSDYYTIAIKVRDIHSTAFGWDATNALPDSKLKEIVDQIVTKEYAISSPRLVATTIAIVADIEEQGQVYDVDTQIKKGYDISEQARSERHRQKYEE